MIRAIFLDIDGTLVSTVTHRAAPQTAEALLKASAAGVLLFTATGRHTRVPEEGYILDRLPDCFDGHVALTGQYCYLRDGTPVLQRPLNPGDVKRVKEMTDEREIAYTYTYEDQLYISRVNDRVRRHNASIGLPIPGQREMDPSRNVYGITLYMSEEEEEQYLKPLLHRSSTVSWIRGIVDICSENAGKRAGVEAILARFGISPEEALAIGDSDNDLSMFEAVGWRAAMGNSTAALRAAADYITETCEADGIYQAFAHYGII